MRCRTLSAAALAVAALLLPAAAAPAAGAVVDRAPTMVDVLAVRSTVDRQVSLLAAVKPMPLAPLPDAAVRVMSNGRKLPSRLQPLLSERSAFGVVVDASMAGSASLEGGGQSGVAGLLLQLPAQSPTAVVADRRPPTVAAGTAAGVSDDLLAVSDLRGSGARATSAAITLALSRLPAGPGAQRVVVLFTGARDAGGESAAELAARLGREGAVLAVVSTHPDGRYWSQVARATGGVAVVTAPVRAITAFDRVADALRGRYVVTFPRPVAATAQTTVRFDTDEGRVLVPVAVPAALAPAKAEVSTRVGAPAAPSGDAGRPDRRWLWLLLTVEAAIAVAVMTMRLRRRGGTHGAEPAAATAAPAAPPGVRVFDVRDPTGPREITDSVFGTPERGSHRGGLRGRLRGRSRGR